MIASIMLHEALPDPGAKSLDSLSGRLAAEQPSPR